MTSSRVQNAVDASCGFLCGFFFMSFACLRGHVSDAAFVGSFAALSACFGFHLIQHLRRMSNQEKLSSFCIGAFVPLSSLVFFCLLMAGSSMNTAPKPIWMIASLAISLGVIATRAGVAVAPALCTSLDRMLLHREQ